jgi:hypothetical protein
MMKRLLLLLSLGLGIFAQSLYASLPPDASQSLYQHMVEVNKEWLHQAQPVGELAEPAAFATDQERIQTHLRLVEKTLRARPTPHLNPAQRLQRLRMLDALRSYWQQGVFPLNTRHSYRVPYFIDDKGTACAVGQLLIESGYRAVAEKVHQEMNYAYLREIPYPELPEWAEAHGFSLAELAWIQPGYSPPNLWYPVGTGGLDAPVDLLLEDPTDGSLIVIGQFTQFSGTTCQGAVKLAPGTGGSITALGSLPAGDVHCGLFFEGELWLGGWWQGPQAQFYNLLRWDGQQWDFSSVSYGPVYCMHVHDGDLYAGGDFHSAIIDNLARYRNGQWGPILPNPYGTIYALTTHQGKLVVGGEYLQTGTQPLAYVIQYDGQDWNPLHTGGDSLDNTVRAFYSEGQTLYAGGDLFNADDSTTFGLAKLTDPADGWEHLLTTDRWLYPPHDTLPNYISQIIRRNGILFLAGQFQAPLQFQVVGYFGAHIAYYDESKDDLEPMAALNGPVHSMLVRDSILYLGGEFNVPFLANYLLQSGGGSRSLQDRLSLPGFELAPHPMESQSILRWASLPGKEEVSFQLFDMQGRSVEARYELDPQQLVLYRDKLPSGLYAFELRLGDEYLQRGRLLVK